MKALYCEHGFKSSFVEKDYFLQYYGGDRGDTTFAFCARTLDGEVPVGPDPGDAAATPATTT